MTACGDAAGRYVRHEVRDLGRFACRGSNGELLNIYYECGMPLSMVPSCGNQA